MTIQPLPVGLEGGGVGYRAADHGWTLTPDGWDQQYDTADLDPTIHPTEAACQAAIDQRTS